MSPRGKLWLHGLLPLVLLAVVTTVFLRFGPLGVFHAAFPPIEDLTIERVRFPAAGQLEIFVVNGGPEPVTVAQLIIDEAYWPFEIEPGPVVARLARAVLRADYPWVEGEPVTVTVLTNTGLTFTEEVDVATVSPAPNRRYFATFTLLGLYVGVIPVFLGVLWFPFLRQLQMKWIHFFLALTAGLLVFLGVDALHEALETADRLHQRRSRGAISSALASRAKSKKSQVGDANGSPSLQGTASCSQRASYSLDRLQLDSPGDDRSGAAWRCAALADQLQRNDDDSR